MPPNAPAPPLPEIDRVRFEEVWRLATFLTGSVALDHQLATMQVFGLRPLEAILFQVVAQANLQKEMRTQQPLTSDTQDYQPTAATNRGVSQRRVAEASGLPRETVRRALARLEARGLMIVDDEGRVQVPIGLIRTEAHPFGPDEVLGPLVALMKQLLKLGVLRFPD